MKNLKLFIAPLLGAALLTACGSKSMDVKDFKTKIEEKFDINAIKAFINKKQHASGTGINIRYNESHEIIDVSNIGITGKTYYNFTFKDSYPIAQSVYHILSTSLVDNVIEPTKQNPDIKVNYIISGETYTIEIKNEKENMSNKFVYNKDFVIAVYESSTSGTGSIDTHLDFNYE